MFKGRLHFPDGAGIMNSFPQLGLGAEARVLYAGIHVIRALASLWRLPGRSSLWRTQEERYANQAARPAFPAFDYVTEAPGGSGHARGTAEHALARRYFRRFRSQPGYGHQQTSRGIGRFSLTSSL